MRMVSSAAFHSRVVLLLLLILPLQAAAGIEIRRFGYFNNGPSFSTGAIDDFSGGGPLENPASAIDWQIRLGTISDSDENLGLTLRPRLRGADFTIGGFQTKAQALEL